MVGGGCIMERKDWSFRLKDRRAFAVDNHRLKVFRIFSDHVYEVSDAYLRSSIRLRCSEISLDEARRICLFRGDLEATLKAGTTRRRQSHSGLEGPGDPV